MSYGEAVLERGAGRRYRWKGRPGLSHKAIKNVACLSDSMSCEAPAEMGGFASSAPSARSGEEELSEGCNFWRARFASRLAAFSALPPLVLFLAVPAAGGSRRMEAVMGKVFSSCCSSLPCSGQRRSFFWGLWRWPGAVLVLGALHPYCRNSFTLAVCGR